MPALPASPGRENSTSIVTLTPAAASKVRDAQKQSGKPLLRVAVKTGGCTGFLYDLQFDDSSDPETDIKYFEKGITIVVDQRSSVYLEGAVVDWQIDGDGQAGFQFNNPNAVQAP